MILPPPCFIICLVAVLAQRKTAVRLTETTLFQSPRDISVAGLSEATPALFTIMSSRPKLLTTSSTNALTSSSLLTSHWKGRDLTL